MSTETKIINLDYAAAVRAQGALQGVNDKKAAEVMDTVATNALGVLLEMGVYGCFLFLLSRTQSKHKEHAKALRRELLGLLGELPAGPAQPPDANDARAVLKYVTEHVTPDLDRVLLARQVLEQMLLYVRYGAAALKPAGKEEAT